MWQCYCERFWNGLIIKISLTTGVPVLFIRARQSSINTATAFPFLVATILEFKFIHRLWNYPPIALQSDLKWSTKYCQWSYTNHWSSATDTWVIISVHEAFKLPPWHNAHDRGHRALALDRRVVACGCVDDTMSAPPCRHRATAVEVECVQRTQAQKRAG